MHVLRAVQVLRSLLANWSWNSRFPSSTSLAALRAVDPKGKPERARSLAPREHGAYGQLALPLVSALAMGRPTLASLVLAAGAGIAFAATEPLRVILGQRGSRAAREDGPRARRRLVLLTASAVALGALGLVASPSDARRAALVPLALAAVMAPLVLRQKDKTLGGELLAAIALSSAGLPVALAGGVPARAAVAAFAAWAVAFCASTLGVRAVVASARAAVPPSAARRLAAPAALAIAAGLLAAGGVWPWTAAASTIPMVALSFVLAARPPEPRALPRVGWTLVVASLMTGASLVASVRLG